MLHLLVATPANAVEFPLPTNTALAPPTAPGTPATGFPPATAIPADPESTAVSESLGIPTSAPPPADDFPATADHRMAAAAPLPFRVSGRRNTSAVGNNLHRDLSMARAAAVADQTFVATEAAEPLDANSVAMPARESVATSGSAESAGLLWQWLEVVNKNMTVSWTLSPVVVALGWLACKWGRLAARQTTSGVRRASVPCAAR
jgi:hypothetical protein